MRVHDDWLLTPERVAIHLPTATAVVADLHLGYDRARRRCGEAVPAVSTLDLLAPLGRAMRRAGVQRLVIAGDLFEESCCTEVAAEVCAWVESDQVQLIGVVPGNHDRDLDSATLGLPVARDGLLLAEWQIVHGDRRLPRGPVVHGHEHPWLRWGRVSAPCFLLGERRLVLPAYSPDAQGVNVVGDPRWSRFRCAAITSDSVLDLGELSRLMPVGRP